MHWLLDVRQAWRWARRNPGFVLTGALTLGIGIGASTSIFSVARALVWTPLAYARADRVCFVLGHDRNGEERFNVGIAEMLELREGTRSFSDMGAYRYWAASLAGDGPPERIQGYHVLPGTLGLLGVAPETGRLFRPDEGTPGAAPVAVLSHGLWTRRFGADPSIVGRTIRLDGEPHLVVGVMPASFEFPVFNYKGDVWSPMQIDAAAALARHEPGGSVVAVGRLADGVRLSTAQADLDAVSDRLARDWPRVYEGRGVRVLPMQELGAEQARPALFSLLGAVLAVLLLAAANVAGLLLARGTARERELAVRAALGAGRGRLVRQLVVESLLLAGAGAAVGVVLAFWLLAGLLRTLPDSMRATVPNLDAIGLDPVAVAFALGLALLTGLAFGVAPALRASRPGLVEALRAGGRSLGGRPQQRLRAGLVVGQVAVSLALLVGAGLALRSFERLAAQDLGFQAEHVLTFTTRLPDERYPDPAARRNFVASALAQLEALPVASVGVVNTLPFSTYDDSTRYVVDSQPPPEPGQEPRTAFRAASPGYFATLGIPVTRGRALSERDTTEAPPVVVVNEQLVRRAFGDKDPIGQRLRFAGEDQPWREIVGVVGNVRHSSHGTEPAPETYVPIAQAPEALLMFALHVRGEPGALVAAARDAIAIVDPEQPVYHVGTLEGSVRESLLLPAGAVGLVSVFGVSALLLAALGLYGLVSYLVQSRTAEIGLRLALGASARDVRRMVLARGARLAAAGMLAGTAGAVAVSWLTRGLLFAVSPFDATSYLGAAALLAVVALLATDAPARRAARLDPMAALRVE